MNKIKENSIFSVRSMVFIAIFAAIICIAAPFSVPLPGLIPISLATFAVYLAGALLGAKRGTIAVIVYILLGAVGLPVFSGFAGGFAKLLGVTGGYIIGYIPCALITGVFADMQSGKKALTMPVGMILGTLACYVFGTAWFIIFTGSHIVSALVNCVVPFLVGDAIKIAAATAISAPLKSRLSGIMYGVRSAK